ncbi:MAG TPA: glycosyltransferase family 2 protein [Chitinophagaceae bacterium]
MPGKVSVQIPTYNQRQYISQAIESVLMQDYPELEIIIADDCSVDGTEEIIKKYKDERIRYFRNEKNIGRVANYRKALYEYSTGDWVVNLDGDDYYTDPSFISRGMQLITESRNRGENVVFYQAAIRLVNDDTGGETRKQHKILGDKDHGLFDNYYLEVYRRNEFFSHLTTIYKRDIATSIGFYEFNTLNIDFESLAKMSFYGKVILDNRLAGVWRVHQGNATHKTRNEFKTEGELLLNRLTGYAKEAYGKDYSPYWKKRIRRETEVLHLELLAENGFPGELLKNIFRYKRFYYRIPVLMLKATIKNIKAAIKPAKK